MISPRWRKMLRDLWLNLPRSLMVVLAIAIGVSGVGFVLDTYSILSREIGANYAKANPASATIWMDKTDEEAIETAMSFPGVADAEKARTPVRCRVKIDADKWIVMVLYVVDDFLDVRINKFYPESGSGIPENGQIIIERASMPVIKAAIGDTITVKAVGGVELQLAVAGTVFDPNQDPAWVNDITYGYVTPQTLKMLGGKLTQTGLRIVTADGNLDRPQILGIVNKLGDTLRQEGYMVERIEVPIPGKFAQTDKINSFLLTLELFGILCLALSGFMTAMLVSSLLSQQIRQIGIMKAIGAGSRQIVGIYLGTVVCLAMAALAIGIPLSAVAGQGLARSTLNMQNMNIENGAVSFWAYATQAAMGIIIPLLVALYPIARGRRITVREAIGDYGVNSKNMGFGRFDKLLERLRGLPRPLMLSLRNAFRRKGRVALTLIMLTLGGASFIAALGSAASWNKSIDNAFTNIRYDIDVRLDGTYQAAAVENSIREVPGVADVEAWGYAMASSFPKYSDGTYGDRYQIFGLKEGSVMITPATVEGRWLQAGDKNAMVLDTDFIDNAVKLGTPVRVGDDITFNLNGKDTAWHVVGIVDMIGTQSSAYVNYGYFADVMNQKDLASCVRVAVNSHDKTLLQTVTKALEQKLPEDGFGVFIIQDLSQTRQVMVNHVVLILALLMLMSLLIAAIGALGLASAMSMNVMERAREIGIMRSIGATQRIISRSVIVEGVIIGFISWILACLASIPLTYYIAGNTGQFIFPRVMSVVLPPLGPFIWLALVLFVSVVASFYPARRSSRLTIRETLAYE